MSSPSREQRKEALRQRMLNEAWFRTDSDGTLWVQSDFCGIPEGVIMPFLARFSDDPRMQYVRVKDVIAYHDEDLRRNGQQALVPEAGPFFRNALAEHERGDMRVVPTRQCGPVERNGA